MMPQQATPIPGFENYMGANMFNVDKEKSFVDKVTAKADVDEIKELLLKEKLTRQDLSQLIYLICANELKFLNLGEWDRYFLGVYFVWLRDFVNNLELIYDYCDMVDDKEIVLDDDTRKMLEDTRNVMMHNVKTSIDLYFFLGRSTLSLGNTAFETVLTNKYEYAYPPIQGNVEEKKSGLQALIMGGKHK